MGHFVGKLALNKLMNTLVMEIDVDREVKKGIFIPFKDNDIVHWETSDNGEEWQLWFRAFAYRQPKSRFTHFLMKFIPKQAIKKLSASQLEAFANHQIGGMIKTDNTTPSETTLDTTDFIQQNI